ncbi:MAG TPA: choice-of-anchor P family protein [Dokdonella sp.]
MFAETGSAGAYDVSIHISVLGLNLDVAQQAPATITDATEPEHVVNQLPSIDFSNALAGVTTGLLINEAQYAPGPSTSAAGGESQVTGLDLSVVNLLGTSLLSISADVIDSRSIVAGYCLSQPGKALQLDDYVFGSSFDAGNLNDNGSGAPGTGGDSPGATLGNLHVSILGIDVPDLPLNPAPNTSIDLDALGIAGASLILNEQTTGGDGTTQLTRASNALHLTLNVVDLITADVVVAHSEAGIDCTQ